MAFRISAPAIFAIPVFNTLLLETLCSEESLCDACWQMLGGSHEIHLHMRTRCKSRPDPDFGVTQESPVASMKIFLRHSDAWNLIIIVA